MIKVKDMQKISSTYIFIITSLTIIAGYGLLSSNTFADDSVVSTATITVPVSCTMNGTVTSPHSAEINNNTYAADIGTTTLHAFCNDNGGFAIYAVGYTGGEIGGTNSNKLVGTPSTIGNIDTGTATSGNTSNWAMKVTKTQDSGDTTGTNAFTVDNSFGSYHTVPSSYTKVAHKDTATDMTASTGGVKLTTTYAAFISKTQPAGTYSGQVRYTLVYPAIETPLQPQTATSGCIEYFANTSTAVGTMSCQSISDSSTTATLRAPKFSRAGYGFAGWSDVYDYSTNANAHFYGPQEDITFTAGQYTGANNGLALYAVWVKSTGSLQDTTRVATLCGSGNGSLTTAPNDGTANLSSVAALTDQRDNQTYAIAKLADGKCWMIENLRLDSTNSDNSTGALAQGYGTSSIYGNFSGLANAESTGFSTTYSANSLYSEDGSNGTININTSDYPAYRMPRYNNENTSDPISTYSYGNYYTWAAAIADTTYNDTGNSSSDATSICPSGWQLPHGGNIATAEFRVLGKAVMDNIEPNDNTAGKRYSSNVTNLAGKNGSAAIRSYPNNFVFSGSMNSSGIHEHNINGYYWSSTVYDYQKALIVLLQSGSFHPGTYEGGWKVSGSSIRCVISSNA